MVVVLCLYCCPGEEGVLAKCYAIASSDYGIAFGVAVCFSSFGSCDAAAGTHYFAGRLRWQKERPHLLVK